MIRQRQTGKKDWDRINAFVKKLQDKQNQYKKLEAVVKVVYPEVIPEVMEMDTQDIPGCIKLSQLNGHRG